jgi:hypothetical protein
MLMVSILKMYVYYKNRKIKYNILTKLKGKKVWTKTGLSTFEKWKMKTRETTKTQIKLENGLRENCKKMDRIITIFWIRYWSRDTEEKGTEQWK